MRVVGRLEQGTDCRLYPTAAGPALEINAFKSTITIAQFACPGQARTARTALASGLIRPELEKTPQGRILPDSGSEYSEQIQKP